MHNWQTTGRQKQLFSDVHDTDISLCPFGCGQSENPQHYLQCLVPPNPDESRTCFRSIASWMKKSLTHPVLQVIIIKAMKIWLKGDSPSAQDITLENEEYEDEIIQAHTNQHAIGWNNFVKERLSKRWSEIQQSHYNMMNRHRNTKCQYPPLLSKRWSEIQQSHYNMSPQYQMPRPPPTSQVLRSVVGIKSYQANYLLQP